MKLDDYCTYWKDRFSRPAGLGNDAIRQVPKCLEAADVVMTRDNTLIEVIQFVDFLQVSYCN